MDLSSSNQQDMDQKLQEGNAAATPMKLFLKVLQCPKPVVCIINGPVMGGGNGLVFGCDLRIATKDSFFSFPEVKRGIVPALISAIIVPQLGQFQSKQHFLLGARIPAPELYRMGMLSSVVDNDSQLKEEAQKFIKELLSSAPNAMSEVKKLVDYTTFNSHQDNVTHVQQVFQKTVHSEEAMYGISCFLKKQTPDWTAVHAKSKL